ncbi:hypothetical protein [Mesorhizobium sp.]|uniref:hypothetical protein n=1 Tax=Mesorhizobium sp. TaxID=1871066 RepID=UPI000FE87503|nr:hypothetical protein [Mesorhizobium sp.]RWE60639.1 MAG: hypothetical protein EOS67_02485 [Mesorhizobium sp.]
MTEPVKAWNRAFAEEKASVAAAWEDFRERLDEQRRLVGHDAKEAEHSAGCDNIREIGMRIFAIPAHTLQGMAVKLRARDRMGLEDFDDPDEALLSIAADVRRLAGEVAS